MGSATEKARPREDTTGFRVRRAFERAVRAGEIVYEEGEEGQALYVIQAGQVELIRGSGEEARVLSRYGAGEFFGEMAVLLGRPRSSRAVAASDARLLELDAHTFQAMCIERPEIAIRVIQRLANRTIELEQRLASLGVDDLLRPVVRVLVRMAGDADGEARLATSLREIAGEAGLRLTEAHRALGQLLDRKLAKLVEDELVIPDLEALSGVLDPAD